MVNSFQKIVDLLLTVIALFFVPIFYSRQMFEDIREIVAREYIREFVSVIQTQGMLTYENYQEFTNKFTSTDEIGLKIERTAYQAAYTENGVIKEAVSYREELGTKEILEWIEQYGKFRMQTGDCITVNVYLKIARTRNKGLVSSVEIQSDFRQISAAGYIRNENWRLIDER